MAKNKGKGKKKSKPNAKSATCLTLEEDEETRCKNPPTHGSPPERCESHHVQYCMLTERYKDASKVVDEIRGGAALPTNAEISKYKDYPSVLDKARWVRRFVEAIRVEKVGRKIHHRRFFLKVDDGHEIRIKVLTKQMSEAVEVLDALEARAWTLHQDLHIGDDPTQTPLKDVQSKSKGVGERGVDSIPYAFGVSQSETAAIDPPSPIFETEAGTSSSAPKAEDDLIEMSIRAEKEKDLDMFRFLLDHEDILRFANSDIAAADPDVVRIAMVQQAVMLQYARRAIFYDPVLSFKAMNKTSMKDLLLDPEFSQENMIRFAIIWEKRLALGLLWWKDATMEALAMYPKDSKGLSASSIAANFGNPEDRVCVVGGYIYSQPHKGNMSNEGWWHLLKSLEPPANIENRFVRLCNSFEDLHAFLSFAAFGMVDPPNSCTETDRQGINAHASRNHLSLCGVIVTDLASTAFPALGPVPSTLPASRPGCVTWIENEFRSYIFGAVRNEPDPFTTRFLEELRSRPDLFIVVTRSETDPGRHVEVFGGSPNETPSQMRYRKFESPPATFRRRPEGRGEWNVIRSAVDVLYGTDPIVGYLVPTSTSPERPGSAGCFFYFKKFPVKYFVILDAKPGGSAQKLARQVAWAATRAQGLGEGEYTNAKYQKASDVLFQKHAKERLSWMPASYGGWSISMTSMAD